MCWKSILISSFSAHSPDTLKEAPVPIISTKKCNSSCMYNGEITSRMLCAGYTEGKVDACQVRCIFLAVPRRGVLKIHTFICDLFMVKPWHNEGWESLYWTVFVSTSPGGQRGPTGVPGWKYVEAGWCCQLGDRLCWAQPSWSLHQSCWILSLDLWHDWGKQTLWVQ